MLSILGARSHQTDRLLKSSIINFGPCLPLLELADEGSARFLMNLITCSTKQLHHTELKYCALNLSANEKI